MDEIVSDERYEQAIPYIQPHHIKAGLFLFATPQVETWLFDKRYAIVETAREAGYLQRHRNAEIGKISNRSS